MSIIVNNCQYNIFHIYLSIIYANKIMFLRLHRIYLLFYINLHDRQLTFFHLNNGINISLSEMITAICPYNKLNFRDLYVITFYAKI